MDDPWGVIADVGNLFTIIAVSPFLIGAGLLAVAAGLFGTSPSMTEQAIRLLVNGLLAMVPLTAGGVFLWMLFSIAEEKSG